MSSTDFLLTPESLRRYLLSRGLARDGSKFTVRALPGGVSNIVLLVEWLDEPARCWVAKQALGKLRVEDDWRSDQERIFREAEAIEILGPVLGDAALPQVISVDRENYFFIMTGAPRGSVVWKESLLAGEIDLAIAREAGLLLGRLMSAPQSKPELAKRLRERFQDQTVFDQLRIDPYYRTTAARHPDVRHELEQLIRDSWKIQTSLVHGDYSPKNMLVHQGKIFLIDFEVIHWGDPAFDAGFLLNHLFLKAMHQPRFADPYFQAVTEFWRALATECKVEPWNEFGALTFRHLGGLMLARIDGKSPVEYICDPQTKEQVRKLAKRILHDHPERLDEIVQMLSAQNC
jgi:5-methylthioribose kinase